MIDKIMQKTMPGFIGRATMVHFVTYFVFGLIFLFFNPFHPGQHAISVLLPEFECFFRSIDDPLVRAGALFQFVRGPILALALFPFRNVFLESKWGWLYLWGLFLGLAILAPCAPAPVSIEEWVYSKLTFWHSISAAPEAILQTLAFSALFFVWERRRERRITIPVMVAFIVAVVFAVLAVFVP